MEKRLEQSKSSCLKVVVFGPESSGKSTLVKQLSQYYQCPSVPEYSRIYAEEKLNQGRTLTKKDILPIALGQMNLENKYAKEADKILFYDTNLLETKIYAEEIYEGQCPEDVTKCVGNSHYDLYILTNIDIPWHDDPIRSNMKEREKMYHIFKNTLINQALPHIIVSGNEKKRFDDAIMMIENILM